MLKSPQLLVCLLSRQVHAEISRSYTNPINYRSHLYQGDRHRDHHSRHSALPSPALSSPPINIIQALNSSKHGDAAPATWNNRIQPQAKQDEEVWLSRGGELDTLSNRYHGATPTFESLFVSDVVLGTLDHRPSSRRFEPSVEPWITTNAKLGMKRKRSWTIPATMRYDSPLRSIGRRNES